MPFFKILLEFLYSRRRIIAVILIVAAVFSLFMYIYGVPPKALVYAGVICAAVTMFAAAGDFVRYYSKFRLLDRLKNEILLTTENLPAAEMFSRHFFPKAARSVQPVMARYLASM